MLCWYGTSNLVCGVAKVTYTWKSGQMKNIHQTKNDTDFVIMCTTHCSSIADTVSTQHFLALIAVLQWEEWCPIQERLRGTWRWLHWIGTHPRVRRETWNVHFLLIIFHIPCRITNNGNYELKVEMWDWDEHYAVARYDSFQVTSESDGFRLLASIFAPFDEEK